MRLRIRPATALDLEAMAAVKDAAWRESYASLLRDAVLAGLQEPRPHTVAAWADAMRDGAFFWVATDGTEVVGIAHATWSRDADAPVPLELAMLYVLDRVQGTGLAQALLHTAIGDADASLWVLDGNERAIRFYRSAGFVSDETTRDVPGLPGVAEVRMVRRADALEE